MEITIHTMSEAPVASSSTLPKVGLVSSRRSEDGDISDDGFGLGLDELLPVCPPTSMICDLRLTR
jgi:hypothetical protein